MPKTIKPITVFCRDAAEAQSLAVNDSDSKALCTGAGTMAFHLLIAQHGAGEFTTLYVPLNFKGSFRCPAGGQVRYTEATENLL